MADKLQAWREDLLKRLNELCSRDGRVPRYIAEDLVEQSAWWETHPSGPVRAPKHAERMGGDERPWFVEFGANSFLVAAAVHGCCERIRQWVHEQQAVPVPQAWEKLNRELHAVVRSSVANYRGDAYADYGHDTQGKLLFGAQAIYMDCFVGGIAEYLKAPALHAFQGRALASPAPWRTRAAKTALAPGRAICPQCKAEVSSSKLASHMQERCPKRTTVQILAAKAKQRAAQVVKPTPPLQLGPGMVICPRCKGIVRATNLKKHLRCVCSVQRPPEEDEAVCPWCPVQTGATPVPLCPMSAFLQ